MKQYYLVTIFFVLLTQLQNESVAQTGLKTGPSLLKKINVNYMLRGYFYAASSIEDTNALGGFGDSDNKALEITGSVNLGNAGQHPFLFIDTTVIEKFGNGYEGYKLILANQSGKELQLPASDSRLSIVAEVFINNKWQPIEYLPSSWCGNSRHTLYLKNNQYWQFTIPKYYGKQKVKLRYKLSGSDKIIYYSNEIIALINKKQLTEKEDHKTNGIMDPYND